MDIAERAKPKYLYFLAEISADSEIKKFFSLSRGQSQITKPHGRFLTFVGRRRGRVEQREEGRGGENEAATRNPFQFSNMGQICSIFFSSHFHFFGSGGGPAVAGGRTLLHFLSCNSEGNT